VRLSGLILQAAGAADSKAAQDSREAPYGTAEEACAANGPFFEGAQDHIQDMPLVRIAHLGSFNMPLCILDQTYAKLSYHSCDSHSCQANLW